jgi:CheY-like chemotaxis protein
MPSGGTVTIGAHNRAAADAPDSTESVAISVEDTGTGIAPDVLDKIFDSFFTTKPVGKGTGLGLSQVHGFAHQAGGTVKVESELGRGTKISILLPRETASPQVHHQSVTTADGSGTVLLVEDNPDVASVSAGLLEQLGYTVRRVPDAEAALREVERDGIDLVFSDIVMPGRMDGLSLARRLKDIRPNLPILLATGYANMAVDVRGKFPIIRKPYEIHQLSQAIAKLRGDHAARAKSPAAAG